MRTLMKVGFALLMLAFVLIVALTSALRSHSSIRTSNLGGREVASERREVSGAIVTIELSGPIDLTLRQGATPSLRVSGEQRLLGNIDTTQDGATLHIGTTGMLLHPRQPLKVELVLPKLQQLTVSGSGESNVNGFSGEMLSLQQVGSGKLIFNGRFRNIDAGLHGSGEMELNGGSSDKIAASLVGSGQLTIVGTTHSLNAQQNGSGEFDAEHLTADEVTLDLNGSGNASVMAKRSATLDMGGSGDVTVYGSPNQRHVNRNGSGEVSWDN